MNAYQEGYECGQTAARSRGGTRGGEWYADQRKLEGDERSAFLDGFSNAMLDHDSDDYEAEMKEDK